EFGVSGGAQFDLDDVSRFGLDVGNLELELRARQRRSGERGSRAYRRQGSGFGNAGTLDEQKHETAVRACGQAMPNTRRNEDHAGRFDRKPFLADRYLAVAFEHDPDLVLNRMVM